MTTRWEGLPALGSLAPRASWPCKCCAELGCFGFPGKIFLSYCGFFFFFFCNLAFHVFMGKRVPGPPAAV